MKGMVLEDLGYKLCKLVTINRSYYKRIKELLLSYGVDKLSKLSEEDILEVNYIVDKWIIEDLPHMSISDFYK